MRSQTQNVSVYSYAQEGVKRLSVSNNRSEMLKICIHSGDETHCALLASGSSVKFDEPKQAYLFTYGAGISRELFDAAERNDMYAVSQIATIYYETDKKRYGTHALKLLRFAANNGNTFAMSALAELIGEMLEREGAEYDAEMKTAAEKERQFWLKKLGQREGKAAE